ncbi:MAG: LapA family protein [Candidatus Aminicenantes bacterium]|nr:LapA family protein [Candidatus Aminicenantes bacterium]
MKPKMIIVLILAFLAVIFIVQNTEIVPVQVYFWKISMSRIIMISFLLLIGFILGYMLGKTQKI